MTTFQCVMAFAFYSLVLICWGAIAEARRTKRIIKEKMGVIWSRGDVVSWEVLRECQHQLSKTEYSFKLK